MPKELLTIQPRPYNDLRGQEELDLFDKLEEKLKLLKDGGNAAYDSSRIDKPKLEDTPHDV